MNTLVSTATNPISWLILGVILQVIGYPQWIHSWSWPDPNEPSMGSSRSLYLLITGVILFTSGATGFTVTAWEIWQLTPPFMILPSMVIGLALFMRSLLNRNPKIDPPGYLEFLIWVNMIVYLLLNTVETGLWTFRGFPFRF